MSTATRRSLWPAPSGNTAIIEKLIAAGADATVARWNGETALMLASRSGSVAGVKALIAHGAKSTRWSRTRGRTL